MPTQPQVDTQLLNDVLSDSIRKRLDEFTKQRVYRAVKAYAQGNILEGFQAIITFHLYFNEWKEALSLTEKAIKNYGYSLAFCEAALETYRLNGEIERVLIEGCRFFEDNQIQNQPNLELPYENHRRFLIDTCLVYLASEKQVQFLAKYLSEHEMRYINTYIAKKRAALETLGISLETYYKFRLIVENLIAQYYRNGFKSLLIVEPEINLAELTIYFDDISVEQASALNNEIDDRILAASIEDEKFGNEVRQLTVYCTLAQEKPVMEAAE